jgi:hypothetical protein
VSFTVECDTEDPGETGLHHLTVAIARGKQALIDAFGRGASSTVKAGIQKDSIKVTASDVQ